MVEVEQAQVVETVQDAGFPYGYQALCASKPPHLLQLALLHQRRQQRAGGAPCSHLTPH